MPDEEDLKTPVSNGGLKLITVPSGVVQSIRPYVYVIASIGKALTYKPAAVSPHTSACIFNGRYP